mmetsp:Transcript_775/g.1075  ORF Transcript_775/g.1075 Transcript_775/m.1075 type:complete len:82 (+) Transcript_775:526-771(+)
MRGRIVNITSSSGNSFTSGRKQATSLSSNANHHRRHSEHQRILYIRRIKIVMLFVLLACVYSGGVAACQINTCTENTTVHA